MVVDFAPQKLSPGSPGNGLQAPDAQEDVDQRPKQISRPATEAQAFHHAVPREAIQHGAQQNVHLDNLRWFSKGFLLDFNTVGKIQLFFTWK